VDDLGSEPEKIDRHSGIKYKVVDPSLANAIMDRLSGSAHGFEI